MPSPRHKVFRRDGLDVSFTESLKACFRSTPRTKGAPSYNMTVDLEPTYRVLWANLRDLISPPKLPPLKLSSKPVPVRPLWAKRRSYSLAQSISFGAHVIIILLVAVPIAHHILPPDIRRVDGVSTFFFKLPPGKDVAHGGGGGGVRQPEPPTQGKLPRWSMTQIAPPLTTPHPNPRMAVEASLLGPPDLKVSSPNDPNFGDPLAKMMTGSGGPGGGSGNGDGDGTGIGNGRGPGLGDGYDGGTGGKAFRPGTGGVGYPTCLYCPEPQYSEDARKAKFQGVVVLQVVIQPDGRAMNIRIVKGPGLGLEERALAAVRTWHFRPALGPNGRPVATITNIEVNFRLL